MDEARRGPLRRPRRGRGPGPAVRRGRGAHQGQQPRARALSPGARGQGR